MSYNYKMEEYYQRFIELQEKLRRSEEERLKLEMKFNEMLQVTREEKQLYFRKLRSQYNEFLEEDRKRQDRNEAILRSLERSQNRISSLVSKTERVNLLRRQYNLFLERSSNTKPIKQPKVESISVQTSFDELNCKPMGFQSDHANSIADEILNSIYTRRRSSVQNKTPDSEISRTDFSPNKVGQMPDEIGKNHGLLNKEYASQVDTTKQQNNEIKINTELVRNNGNQEEKPKISEKDSKESALENIDFTPELIDEITNESSSQPRLDIEKNETISDIENKPEKIAVEEPQPTLQTPKNTTQIELNPDNINTVNITTEKEIVDSEDETENKHQEITVDRAPPKIEDLQNITEEKPKLDVLSFVKLLKDEEEDLHDETKRNPEELANDEIDANIENPQIITEEKPKLDVLNFVKLLKDDEEENIESTKPEDNQQIPDEKPQIKIDDPKVIGEEKPKLDVLNFVKLLKDDDKPKEEQESSYLTDENQQATENQIEDIPPEENYEYDQQYYDENGQPLYEQYDENGQPLQYYQDENGEIVQYYPENPEYYNEQEQYYAEPQAEEGIAEKNPETTEQPEIECVNEEVEDTKPSRVIAMLESDSETTRNEPHKSVESDFDFSNN